MRQSWRIRQQRVRDKKKKNKASLKDSRGQTLPEASSTGSSSTREPQDHDMEGDDPAASTSEGSTPRYLGIAPPGPIPLHAPHATTSNPSRAPFRTKKVIYVPDPTRHITTRSEAKIQVGWNVFQISEEEYAKVRKLEGLAMFKRKTSKSASPQSRHEVLMHEWVRSRSLLK
jgi:hypothetical protein